jgi:hypothetical protein
VVLVSGCVCAPCWFVFVFVLHGIVQFNLNANRPRYLSHPVKLNTSGTPHQNKPARRGLIIYLLIPHIALLV